MSCERYEAALIEIARERPIEAVARGSALEHARRCETCAARLAAERLLTAEMRALAGSAAEREASDRVEAVLSEAWAAGRASKRRSQRWRWGMAVAAAVALVLAGMALVGRAPGPRRAAPAEVATEFIPLMYVDQLDASQPHQVLRVRMPRTALVRFGIPVNQDRASEPVTADLVVGYDGLPRAIRFVE